MQDSECWTALSYATALGLPEIVELLLKQRDINVNAVDAFGYTALHWAIKNNGNIELVSLLLAYDSVEVNTLAHNSTTPLSDAFCCGNPKVVQALVRRGASLKFNSQIRGSVMHWLAKSGYFSPELCAILLNEGDALEARSPYGATPIHVALKHGTLEAVRYFLDKEAVIDAKDLSGKNALHFAAMSRVQSEEKVILVLQHGIDILGLDSHGSTPARCATESVAVKLLCTRGVDVNARDQMGRTALDAAILDGRDETVEGILSLDALKINAADPHGQTSLHLAVIVGDIELVTRLLQAGASPNNADKYDRTPLHHAVNLGRCDTVKELMCSNADPKLADCYGRSAYDYMTRVERVKKAVGNLFLPPSPSHQRGPARDMRIQIHSQICRLLDIRAMYEITESDETQIKILGRRLMHLGNFDDAITAFQLHVSSSEDGEAAHRDIVCDLCDYDPMKGSRWVCRVCPDTDLCTQCLELHRASTYSSLRVYSGCIGHDFLEVPGPGWSSRSGEAVNDQGESYVEWLQRLRTTFEPISEPAGKQVSMAFRSTLDPFHVSEKAGRRGLICFFPVAFA